MYDTTIIALSASDAKKFRSDNPYVVMQFTEPGERHPYVHAHATRKAIAGWHFDDIIPEDATDPDGFQRFIPMSESQAAQIARFVKAWYGKVATIVVHCKAGLSRSVGAAVAIREHYGHDTCDLFAAPRLPNAHCRAMVKAALDAT